jgi:preprotein translocase subunit SecG
MHILMGLLLAFTAIFLILLVLVQRGRGGGLTGALGGMGGQSAFGAKAGDLFTRITIGTATVWILFCVLAVKFLGSGPETLDPSQMQGPESSQPAPGPPVSGGQPAAEQSQAREAERSSPESK